MGEMTHNALCDIAVKWLLRPVSAKGPNCKVAFKEVADVGAPERADAWGTGWGWKAASTLVEVKMSRSDFFADKKKPHRQPDAPALGDYRYFMCPEGVIQLQDLPERWGLLWVNSRGHVKVKAGHLVPLIASNYGGVPESETWKFSSVDKQKECSMLAYMFARIGDPDKLLQEQRQHTYRAERLARQLDAANAQLKKYQTQAFINSLENRHE